jgi:hypothetical protein
LDAYSYLTQQAHIGKICIKFSSSWRDL